MKRRKFITGTLAGLAAIPLLGRLLGSNGWARAESGWHRYVVTGQDYGNIKVYNDGKLIADIPRNGSFTLEIVAQRIDRYRWSEEPSNAIFVSSDSEALR